MAPYPGRIFVKNNFKLPGGVTKRKYFVILTDCPLEADNVLIVITTSKQKSDPIKGCYNNTTFPSFYLPTSDNPIGSESWVMLGEVFSVNARNLSNTTLIGDLTLDVTKEVLACAAGSERIEGSYKRAIKAHADLLN